MNPHRQRFEYRPRPCLVCGKPFRTKAAHTKTCGPTCRKRLSRHPELLDKE